MPSPSDGTGFVSGAAAGTKSGSASRRFQRTGRDGTAALPGAAGRAASSATASARSAHENP